MSNIPSSTLTERKDGPSTMLCNESGWWEAARAEFIRERIVELTGPQALIADVGCGRGRLLGGSVGRRTVVNVDSYVWDEWTRSSNVFYVCASADALPFPDGVFDVVGSFDVLEHVPDDTSGLAEQRRVVRRDGRVVTAVPADDRLWSRHDAAAGHYRRYGVTSFVQLAHRSGLHVELATHFFSYLWLPAWLTRRQMARSEPGNGSGLAATVLRRAVGVCSAAERLILRRYRLPFGTSLWIESVPQPESPVSVAGER